MKNSKIIYCLLLFCFLISCKTNLVEFNSGKPDVYKSLIKDFEERVLNKTPNDTLKLIEIFSNDKILNDGTLFTFYQWKKSVVVVPDSIYDVDYILKNDRIYYWQDKGTKKKPQDFYGLVDRMNQHLDSCAWFKEYSLQKCKDYMIDISKPIPLTYYKKINRNGKQHYIHLGKKIK